MSFEKHPIEKHAVCFMKVNSIVINRSILNNIDHSSSTMSKCLFIVSQSAQFQFEKNKPCLQAIYLSLYKNFFGKYLYINFMS